jgi:enterochelin esterase-like enzyme
MSVASVVGAEALALVVMACHFQRSSMTSATSVVVMTHPAQDAMAFRSRRRNSMPAVCVMETRPPVLVVMVLLEVESCQMHVEYVVVMGQHAGDVMANQTRVRSLTSAVCVAATISPALGVMENRSVA